MAAPGLTLLQIVNRVQGELGLPIAATVIGNSDPTTTQLRYLAERCLDELRRIPEQGWTALQMQHAVDVIVPISTTCDISSPGTDILSNIPSTAGIEANTWTIQGTAIPPAARVIAVLDANTIQMDMLSVNTEALTSQSVMFAKDTYPEPAGFDYMQNRSMWDRTNRWELIGPTSPQLDQWHKSGIVTTGPRRNFRQLGPYANNWQIWPPPFEITAPLQLEFEYLSIYGVYVNGSQTDFAQFFENDDDVPILDSQAIIMGIKWMFWEIKGFGSYVTLQNRWVDYVDKMIGRDGSAATLQLAKRVSPVFLSPANVQDGFFPGPTGQNGT